MILSDELCTAVNGGRNSREDDYVAVARLRALRILRASIPRLPKIGTVCAHIPFYKAVASDTALEEKTSDLTI